MLFIAHSRRFAVCGMWYTSKIGPFKKIKEMIKGNFSLADLIFP